MPGKPGISCTCHRTVTERGTKRQRSDTSAADEDETVHAAHVSGRGVHLQFGSRRPPPKEGHSVKEWGHDSTLWSHCFDTYAAAWMSIFGKSFPTAGIGMVLFHRRICDLARVYKWQDGVLLLALDKHQLLLDKGISTASVEDWNIDTSLEGQYLRLDTLLPSNASPAVSPLPTRSQRTAAQPNRESAICQRYNTVGCAWTGCKRRHVCSKCEGDHPLPSCKKK